MSFPGGLYTSMYRCATQRLRWQSLISNKMSSRYVHYCHSWTGLGGLTNRKQQMTLGLVSRRVEMESRYVSRPSESHMFSEGACDLAVISVGGKVEDKSEGFSRQKKLIE